MRHTRTGTGRSYGPVLACTRRDSPFHRFLFVNAQRVTRTVRVPCASHLDRIMTENRPCRFCAIAVTLATRTCVRLRARWVGGLSSATLKSPSAALSLSCSTMIFYQISTAHEPAVVPRFYVQLSVVDRLLSMVHKDSLKIRRRCA